VEKEKGDGSIRKGKRRLISRKWHKKKKKKKKKKTEIKSRF